MAVTVVTALMLVTSTSGLGVVSELLRPIGAHSAGAGESGKVTAVSGARALDESIRAEFSGVDVRSAADASSERITIVSAADGLEATLLASLASLDGVIAVAGVRTAAVGLLGSFDADGVAHDVLPSGYRIPVTVTALEPGAYGPTLEVLTEEDAALLELLERRGPGNVLLSESSAALRGLGVGGSVDLGSARGLRVAGIVEDRTARGSEFLVHVDDAVDIGLGRRESLVVRHVAAASEVLVRTAGELAGDDVRLWQDRRQDPRQVRLVLSQAEVKARFGEFAFRLVPNQREVEMERAFVAEYITVERMPVLGDVRCHRMIMDDLRAALEEIVDAGLEEWLAPGRYGGCYHPRRIGFGRENLSRHTWGIAIDLNVDFAVPGAGPVPPDEFIAIMGRHGFRWGGDFTTPDNHHYEWIGEAARIRPERAAS